MTTIQISSGVKRSRTSAPTALVALLAVGLAAVGSAAPAAAQETKPNILFIMGDDIGLMQPASITAGGWSGTPHRPHRQ